MSALLSPILFLVSALTFQCACAEHQQQLQDPDSTALVDWIRSRGGHVDHRQTVRHEIPGNPSSLRGIFAAEDIPENTLLLYLPWSEVIVADPHKGDSTDQCGSARAVRREMELGDESYYAPYVKLLNDQRTRIGLPNAWSGAGLALLDRIVSDRGLAPADNQRHLAWWTSHCGGDPDGDPLGRDAALLQVMRACGVTGGESNKEYRTVMVPYYDMYNHRNGGRWHNTHIQTELFRGYKVLASRDIRAGEQLYNSYGEDAASALRDYGFIEQLPQLWNFGMPSEGGNIQFDLDEDERGKVAVEWRLPPPKHAAEFMRLEIERLDRVEEKWRDVTTTRGQTTTLPENEAALAWGYHEALKRALSAAVSSLESIQRDGGKEL